MSVTEVNRSQYKGDSNKYIKSYRGESTDTKPTLDFENVGSKFFEYDTSNCYEWDGTMWRWIA